MQPCRPAGNPPASIPVSCPVSSTEHDPETWAPVFRKDRAQTKRSYPMHLTLAHISPLVALIAGVLILIVPRLLNYIVAIYLIVIGLVELNAIHHFIR